MTVGLYKPQRNFVNEMRTEHLRTYWWDWELWNHEDQWEKLLSDADEILSEQRTGLPYRVDIQWTNKSTTDLVGHGRALMRWLESEVGEGNYAFTTNDKENTTSVYFREKRKAFMFKLKWA